MEQVSINVNNIHLGREITILAFMKLAKPEGRQWNPDKMKRTLFSFDQFDTTQIYKWSYNLLWKVCFTSQILICLFPLFHVTPAYCLNWPSQCITLFSAWWGPAICFVIDQSEDSSVAGQPIRDRDDGPSVMETGYLHCNWLSPCIKFAQSICK